jgi:oligopeptidase B
MPTPPIARRTALTHDLHGDSRPDDYHWLRDRDNPETIAYLEAENAYLKEVMQPLEGVQETLYAEMRARIQEADLEVPARYGAYWYYSRTEEGRQYRVYCRKHGSLEAQEEVLLDLNAVQESGGYAYLRLGVYEVSPDARLLAFALDTNGSEKYHLQIRNLETGETLETIDDVYYGLEWSADSRHVFYTRVNASMRPHQIWRCELGSANDALVYEETDETFFLGISKTSSEAWLCLTSNASVTSEARLIPAAAPLTPPVIFKPRVRGLEYSISHLPGRGFLVRLNADAPNFEVRLAPETNTAEQNSRLEGWRPWLPHDPARLVSSVMAFQDHVVIWGREAGFTQLWVMDDAHGLRHVSMPDAVYSVYPGTNLEFDTVDFRFQYVSLAQPRQVSELNLNTLERRVLKEDPVLGGFDASQYVTQRLEATSSDGVKVPISVVYRKDALDAGSAPLYLYGYGSYGASMDPYFSNARLSLLNRGVVFAIAHVRGGQELGRAWYEDGKLLRKRNTFSDFIACAEHLIALGYTSSAQLAISGGSAGGLLVGAAVTMRPDLFRVVVASVPFVDVVTTMLDDTLPLTTNEYDEWGNPNDATFYTYMKSYSPYDNTVPAAYPHLFVTAGLNDPRVSYHEPAKWVARLRAVHSSDAQIVLHTNMGAGHGGSSGRFDALREVAMEYAFVLDRIGAKV